MSDIIQEQEEYVGVWEVWHRYQRGHAIAKRHVRRNGHLYLLRKTSNGFWTCDTYVIKRVELQEHPTTESLANRKEFVVAAHRSRGTKFVPIYAIGYDAFTAKLYAMRECTRRNSELNM